MRVHQALAVFLGAALTACSGTLSMQNDIATERGEQVKRELRAAWKQFSPGELRLKRIAEHKTHTTYFLVAKSHAPFAHHKNGYIPGDFMRQNGKADKLAVLFSGMGETVSTITIANRLAVSGYDVLRLYPKIELFDFKELDSKEKWTGDEFRVFVRRGRRVLAARYEDAYQIVADFKKMYQYNSVGVMGISLGGITAYYLSGAHPELFQSTAGIITGGKLCEILLVSEEPRIIEIKEKVFKKFAITRDKAQEVLCEELYDIDPLSVAGNIDPATALLVSNALDYTIPHRFTKALWRASGKPAWKLMTLKLPFVRGHESSGFALFFPVPLLASGHCLWLPAWPQNADALVLQHFEKTLQ